MNVGKFIDDVKHNQSLRDEFLLAVRDFAKEKGYTLSIDDLAQLELAQKEAQPRRRPVIPGSDVSSKAIGEEDRGCSTEAVGEEDGGRSTEAVGEEDTPRRVSTLAMREEDSRGNMIPRRRGQGFVPDISDMTDADPEEDVPSIRPKGPAPK